ncbi:hypothetical protein ASF87_13030 [Microbacterium sp. Leaf161]|uniref:SHOCT domain-containing protein n=1 Tax=Microbacterium sp. Leaf161 TaxID=1736281 RepID=UPI0006FA8DB8|nr:SHOCT domain-containing protein [Microbacterium sp. Leaf161]KQR45185.1 hypothetical protein ASF87_13030 [Microbacterium sp. Leaf161]
MPLFNRFGRPGLLGLAARTAVVAGTATAVSGAMRGSQQRRAEQAAEADAYQAQQQQEAVRYAADQAAQRQPASSGGDTLGELERLSSLHQQGALTDQEFQAAKAKILN